MPAGGVLERARTALLACCVVGLSVGCAQKLGARASGPPAVPESSQIARFTADIRTVNRISAENNSRAASERTALRERDPGGAELLDYVESHPDDLEAKHRLATVLLERQLYWSAYGLFEELELKSPGRWDVALGLASVWDAWGEYDLALESARRAASIQPSAAAYAVLGRVQLHRGEFSEAAGAFLRADELQPNDGVILASAGFAFLSQGRCSEARRYLERAVALEPEMDEARYSLAVALAQLDEYERALEQLLEIGPPAVAWNNLGALYLRKHQAGKAYDAFARAVALDAGYELAVQNLAVARSRLPAPVRITLPLGRSAAASMADDAPSTASAGDSDVADGLPVVEARSETPGTAASPEREASPPVPGSEGLDTAATGDLRLETERMAPEPSELHRATYSASFFCILVLIGGGIVRLHRKTGGAPPPVAKSRPNY